MMACFFLLVMSACYVEESGRVCTENGSSITVSTLLDVSIDSVRYFLKGELICSSPKSKGEHLERNVFCDGEYCVKESSLEGYERRVMDYCAVGSLCDSGLTKILNGDSFENDSCSNDFCVANHNQRPEPGRPYMVFFLEQQKTAT